MLNAFFRNYRSLIHTCITELLKVIKLHAALNTKTLIFSFSHCFGPLIGFWGGAQSTCIVYVLRTLIRLSTFGLAGTSLLYHIPSFCGALYLSSSSRLARIGIPLACFMLFSWHPVGNQVLFHSAYWLLLCTVTFLAVLLHNNNHKILMFIPLACFMIFAAHPAASELVSHSFYWSIPIIIALINPRSVFLQALGSTFTSHAVGSVIWLYCTTTSLATWHSLVSIIWLERLIFALGMTLIYYSVAFAQKQVAYWRLRTSYSLQAARSF